MVAKPPVIYRDGVLSLMRLNGDTSWFVSWNDTTLAIDPWLIGAQVDGFRWFSSQSHVDATVLPADVPSCDAIVLTQPFTDHTHEATLAALGERPIVGVRAATRRVAKWFPHRAAEMHVLSKIDAGWVRVGSLRIAILRPTGYKPPGFNALVIANEDNEVLLYAPHGINLRADDIAVLQRCKTVVLLTSLVEYRLPWWLGGVVSPGHVVAVDLVNQLSPQTVVSTHDEAKQATGLVARVAKRSSPEATMANVRTLPIGTLTEI